MIENSRKTRTKKDGQDINRTESREDQGCQSTTKDRGMNTSDGKDLPSHKKTYRAIRWSPNVSFHQNPFHICF